MFIKLFNDYMKLLYFGFNINEIILFCYIISLSKEKGYCAESDKFFMNYLKVSRRTIQYYLNNLENYGLITKYFNGNERRVEANEENATKIIENFEY